MRPLWIALSLLACASAPALAESCPGNPDAIGTSRIITVDPAALPLIGTMQYKNTLPLEDHEVVITFDDGPIPPYSTHVLDTLAENCVKATYFLVGEMARDYPWLVRRIYNEGHTIGTHSETHPLALRPQGRCRASSTRSTPASTSVRAAARRRPRRGAVLPHPRPRAAATRSKNILARNRSRCGAPTKWPTTGTAASRRTRSCSAPSAASRRKSTAASCCCTTSIPPPRWRCRSCSASSRRSAITSCRWCRPATRPPSVPELAPPVAQHDAWPRIVKASVTAKRHHARHLLRHRHRAAHRRHQAANAEKAANLGYRGLWNWQASSY